MVTIAPARHAQLQQESFGSVAGDVIGKGLNSIIESKIEGLRKAQGIHDNRKMLKDSNLPEWLIDLHEDDPETFRLFLKEFDFASPEKKEEMREQLNEIDPTFHGDGEEFDEDEQQAEQPQSPWDQNQQLTSEPIEGENVVGEYTPLKPVPIKEKPISGMNSLMQAGNGAQRESSNIVSQAQDFPTLGHGTKGQPSSTEQLQPTGLRRKTKPVPGLTPYQKEHLDFQNKQLQQREEAPLAKSNVKFVNDIYEKEAAKHDEDNVLKRVIHVSEQDNVRNPILSGVMRQIGIDYEGLKNNDTLEVNKLSNWFLRGGVKMFGGKVSNAEMYALLQSVPNALQTKEGRIRLAKQMLLANQDYHDEKKITARILKDNNDKIPLGIRFEVDREMEAKREKNAEKFIKGIYDEQAISHKVGQRVNDLSKLPEGAEVKKEGKTYIIKNGKPVPKE